MGRNSGETEGTVVKSKLVVVGDCGCGKTALIQRYTRGVYTEGYTPSSFDTSTATYSVSDTYHIQMSIWDTPGDSGFDGVRPLSYTDADLIVICFNIGDPDSMANAVTKWGPEVRENCPHQPIILVGCQSDLRHDLKSISTLAKNNLAHTTYEQGLKSANVIGALVYSETSSKTSHKSVTDVMEVAALSSAGSNSLTINKSAVTTNKDATDDSSLKRQRSVMKKKRFNGVSEAKAHLRKEVAKGCSIM
ncbi:hypothetical protein ScPMuIL_015526 [Solemya velum]